MLLWLHIQRSRVNHRGALQGSVRVEEVSWTLAGGLGGISQDKGWGMPPTGWNGDCECRVRVASGMAASRGALSGWPRPQEPSPPHGEGRRGPQL